MPAKQAINGKLQGSVAAYLRCGGVVNNQITSKNVNKNIAIIPPPLISGLSSQVQGRIQDFVEGGIHWNISIPYPGAIHWKKGTFFIFWQCVGKVHKEHETTKLFLVTLPNIHRFEKITHTLSNKPFLIRLRFDRIMVMSLWPHSFLAHPVVALKVE